MGICSSDVFSTMRTVTEVLRLQHRQNDLKWMNLVPAGSPTMLSNHQTNVHVLQAKLERMLLTYGASLKYPPPPVNVWRLALGLATGNRAHYFIVSSKAQMLRKGVYIHTYIHTQREREREMHCCSVAQSCLTLCNPMDCSTPGLPVQHQLPEFTQTHVHQVIDAIQPSHFLSSPSPPDLNLSQHQGLFQ